MRIINKFLASALLLLFAGAFASNLMAQTVSLPLSAQPDYVKLHKFLYWAAANPYRGSSTTLNTDWFAAHGEGSIYLSEYGNIIYPDTLPQLFSTLASSLPKSYDLSASKHWVVQSNKTAKRIAIFKSKTGAGNTSISWEALYFQRLFDELLPTDAYYFLNEDSINSGAIPASTELIVFPAVKIEGQDYNYYVNQIAAAMPSFATKMAAYIQKGGNIYSEGNGALFLETAGILASGSINYAKQVAGDGTSFFAAEAANTDYPLSLAPAVAGNKLYSTAIPEVKSADVVNQITLKGQTAPLIFTVQNKNIPFAHQVVANLGLTATQTTGTNRAQSLYTLQSILGFFSSRVDVTRNVRNTLSGKIVAGPNAIAYDVIDTFTVNIQVRNLSDVAIDNVIINEQINPYFSFNKTVAGSASLQGNTLVFSSLSLAAHETKTLSYSLITPVPDSKKHEDVDLYLAEQSFISAAKNSTTYQTTAGTARTAKNHAFADLLFSARIFADADVNWKNFLSLDYQPFKIFLNMENKSRTQAEQVVYTQYIPKDVPYYQSDQSINIPILRTPGGKFVTVMRGSNDQKNPQYDYDQDGLPDAWLDTASIYPKGYTIVEDSVYWANPWAHLKTGSTSKYIFEDIDHDGAVAKDTDGDGVVDVEEPGDKIRVWKVSWNIGTVAGYEYYEPYCSYELWLDPPKQVELSAGVAKVYDSLKTDLAGMYFPFSKDIASANKADNQWKYWMETDNNGNVIWKELVLQSANNYEGYTFIDTAKTHYKMRPTDKIIGRAPQPHNEFIAVVSMGGEEIDMTHWTPSRSLYSNVDYKTIFGEEKRLPIRTTYTYYAPLPNPLQFEYLNDRVTIKDTNNRIIQDLPHRGKATLQFDIDASTEYSYYWIRGVGHDVEFNDASAAAEGDAYESMGDGVFGYFVYEIPKGMGGYSITLPRNEDGTFKTNEIVQVNGAGFQKWLNNPNTHNEVEVWENALSYQIYIPQVLIPPALDDNNHDGIDDWRDDRGDRFSSKTGFLRDAFMLGNGESYPKSSTVSHYDNLAGTVDSGWVAGADKTFGDDEFEALGKTHFTITAQYEGRGREGQLEVSKGGTLVCEEIFGGSPWVIFSHSLSSKSEGLDLTINSSIHPSIVKIGIDTVYLKHTIEDKNEPHNFNINFDPFHASLGFSDANITTHVGAKDPCNYMNPAIAMPAIVDPSKTATVKLLSGVTGVAGFPKTVTGAFVEVRVEVSNCSNDDWLNTVVTPSLPAGATLVMQYVAYPRPLVPNDKIGGMQAGWRFNQPEGEVLVNIGNKIPLIQPTRRAYFVYLFSIAAGTAKGIYEVPFTIAGEKVNYTGTNNGALNYTVPTAKYCVADKNGNGSVKELQSMALGQALLKQLEVTTKGDFRALGTAKWSLADVDGAQYAAIKDTLKPNGSLLNLAKIGAFPNKNTGTIFILQPGVVDSYNSDKDELQLTNGQNLKFKYNNRDSVISSKALSVTPIGPKIRVSHTLYSINGKTIVPGVQYESDKTVFASTLLKAKNFGADISKSTIIKVQINKYFEVITDSLPTGATVANSIISIPFGDMLQGEEKTQFLYFKLKTSIPKSVDISKLINKLDINYTGTAITAPFHFAKDSAIIANLFDIEITQVSYTQIDNATIHVTATAFNKGVAAKNVWFRIYPVIGQGAAEFFIVEQKVETWAAGESITIETDYSLPNIGKSLEMLAMVDDEDGVIETSELNNREKTGFILTSLNDLTGENPAPKVSPNPFVNSIAFDYVLNKHEGLATITLLDANGAIVKQTNNNPANSGANKVIWSNLNLSSGTYFYKIEVAGVVIGSGKLIK